MAVLDPDTYKHVYDEVSNLWGPQQDGRAALNEKSEADSRSFLENALQERRASSAAAGPSTSSGGALDSTCKRPPIPGFAPASLVHCRTWQSVSSSGGVCCSYGRCIAAYPVSSMRFRGVRGVGVSLDAFSSMSCNHASHSGLLACVAVLPACILPQPSGIA